MRSSGNHHILRATMIIVHTLLHCDEIAEGMTAERFAVDDVEAELKVRDVAQQIDRRADEEHPGDQHVEREPERIPPTRGPRNRDLAADEAHERAPLPLQNDQPRQEPDDEEIEEAVPLR